MILVDRLFKGQPRKLLMHRREIERLIGGVEQKGFTLVPLEIYFNKGKAKVAIARKLLVRLFIMLRDHIDYDEFRRRGHQAPAIASA